MSVALGRDPRSVNEIIIVALRTSPGVPPAAVPEAGPANPTVEKTLAIPGTGCGPEANARRTCSVTATVVARLDPGGSSTCKVVTPVSLAGTKPRGISGIKARDPRKNRVAPANVTAP